MQLLNFENDPAEVSSMLARRQLARDEAMLQWADQVVGEDESTTMDTDSLRLW